MWGTVLITLGAIGGASGIVALAMLMPRIIKMRSETKKVDVDAAVAAATAEDEHLKTIVDYVVKPLRERVEDQDERINQLETKVATFSKRYFALIDWARQVLAWQRGWHKDIEPPMPTIPAEVAEDL